MKLPPWLIGPPVAAFYKLWCSTLRVSEKGRDTVDELHDSGRLLVFCLWHDEFFPLLHLKRQLRLAALISRSRDGEYLARLMHYLGFEAVRGSSSRGGSAGLLQGLSNMREKGLGLCVTMDGPRGPRHQIKDGVFFLAQQTGALLVPVRAFCAKAKIFNSWDRFQLPLPFSRVQVIFGPPYAYEAPDLEKDSLNKERSRLEEKMRELTA